MKFTATIQLDGKTATGIPVPHEVVDKLNGGKRPAVSVTIKGYTYLSTIGSMGGIYKIPVSSEHRVGAGIEAGDKVEVEVVLDTKPREVSVPPILAIAFKENPAAEKIFNTLSPSNKKRIVLSIESAKTEETRQRRLGQVMESLK